MNRLEKKLALVTGAASGIGEAIARRFAAEGATVIAVDRDAQGLANLSASMAEEGPPAVARPVDIGDAEACARLAGELLSMYPSGLDILVNNAGVGAVGTVLQTDVNELDRLYRVNVRAPYLLSQLFLPAMLARRQGCILHLASIGGIVALRERAAYCTTKFAIVGLTKAMALDHAADQVRVNCICPARVETPFVAARVKEYPDPALAYQRMCQSQPIGRMARPEEIAAAAVYLSSDDAAFVTGSALIIDGGLSAGC